MAQSTATMSPAYSAGDALFFCIGVRPRSHISVGMERATLDVSTRHSVIHGWACVCAERTSTSWLVFISGQS